jgi:S-formylglutathione hydrolase FrmB
VVAAAAAIALCMAAPARAPSTERAAQTVERYEVQSRFVHRRLAQTAVVPAGGGAGRPLLVFLHGRERSGTEANANGRISMGGFGAFAIARRRPSRFCAVGGHSAALWLRSGDTAPGAFDNAADFGRHDLIRVARARGRAPWGSARLWLDGGRADPFRVADDRFASALSIPMHHWAGGHDGAYWQRHYKRYLRFYAAALAAC